MSFPVLMFAAGFGTRMKHLTADRPKPLVEVAGKPLIDHTLALAEEVNASVIVANLHYHAEMLQKHLLPRDVKTVVEHPDILETGGGLCGALPILGDGPVITMNTAVCRLSKPIYWPTLTRHHSHSIWCGIRCWPSAAHTGCGIPGDGATWATPVAS